MDTDSFNQRLSAIHRAFPDFQRPSQPTALPRVDGQFYFSIEAFFANITRQVDAGTYRLRAPASSAKGLYGPFRAQGTCLVPLSHDGDMHWVDPQMQPQTDDIVLVEWHPDVLAGIVERGIARGHGFLEMYGDNPPPIACKLLTTCGGEYYLATNESVLALEPNRILGVVRRIERNGISLYDSNAIGCIAPNAASQVASNYNAAGVTAVYPNSSTPTLTNLISATVTATGAPVAIDAMANVKMEFSTLYTLNLAQLVILRDGVALSNVLWDGSGYTGSTIIGNIPVTLTLTDTPSAGSHTYTLAANLAGTNSGTGNFDLKCTQLMIKIREYKR
jgi:hypothetical protein